MARNIVKGRGNIATLPVDLRRQINEKLRENRSTYRQIATWLLGVVIEDEGVPVSTRYDGTKDPVRCCEMALCHWFRGAHYKRWAAEAASRDDALRRLKNFEQRFQSVGEEGADNYVKSIVLQGMEDIATGVAKPADLFMLANAWARIRGLKKGDAHADEIRKKLEKLAEETKAARDKGKPLDDSERGAILDKVDEILLGGKKQ